MRFTKDVSLQILSFTMVAKESARTTNHRYQDESLAHLNLDLSDGRHVLMRATEDYDRMKHPMPRLQLNASTRRINELLIQQEFLAIYRSVMHN